MSSSADFYFQKGKWQPELAALRTIIRGFPLGEQLKWGVPCYTLAGGNVLLVHVFKAYCAVLFFRGALMADPEGILVRQTPNVQVPRLLRFGSLADIEAREEVIRNYIREAIRVERAGLRMDKAERPPLELPEEFRKILDADAGLRAAFEALTPGRQRAYTLFFSAPKQSKTRTARVAKSIPKILDGKGPGD